MMLTGVMFETMTASDLAQRLAHDLIVPETEGVWARVSSLFTRTPERGSWRFRKTLDTSALDYTVTSLAAVDRHLEEIYNSLPEGDDGKDIDSLGYDQLRSLIPTVGSYVGEVFRRNGAGDHVWEYHHSFIEKHPDKVGLVGDEPSPSTIMMLVTESGGFTLPLGKVFKFLLDGPGDATQALAFVLERQARERSHPDA